MVQAHPSLVLLKTGDGLAQVQGSIRRGLYLLQQQAMQVRPVHRGVGRTVTGFRLGA